MPGFDTSLSMIVAASKRDDCNRLMRALERDAEADPGKTFSVGLTANESAPATHYGAHTWDDDLTAILQSGTLPSGIDWGAFGLTQTKAQQALNAIKFRAVINRTPRANWEAHMTNEAVKELPSEAM